MDDLIEILLELILEGSSELLQNKKVPKWIRIIIALIFIGFLIGIISLGVMLLNKSILGGIIIIGVGVFLLIGIIIKIRKYMEN